jgi:prophage regulatory protein
VQDVSPSCHGKSAASCAQPDLRNTASPRIISIKDVQHLTSLCKSSIYELMRLGEFPRSIDLGARRVGWLLSEVEGWIRGRVSAASAPACAEKA